jgi:hypothetical protein
MLLYGLQLGRLANGVLCASLIPTAYSNGSQTNIKTEASTPSLAVREDKISIRPRRARRLEMNRRRTILVLVMHNIVL